MGLWLFGLPVVDLPVDFLGTVIALVDPENKSRKVFTAMQSD
jgi:hypothetical protein